MGNLSPEDLVSRRRKLRIAIIIAAVFHAVLLAVFAGWYVNRQGSATNNQDSPVASTTAPAEPTPAESPEVEPEKVAATLAHSQDRLAEKTDEEQLDLLDQKAKKLEEISSPESVNQIADKFHEWMETEQRASVPREEEVSPEEATDDDQQAEGDADASPATFDFQTAQIHNIRREETDDGFRYMTVLVDAQGLTMESELPAGEGETVYATFQRLKKFPLADQVYRQIAMPLMDKILAAEQSAQQASRPLPTAPAAAEEAEEDRDPFDASP